MPHQCSSNGVCYKNHDFDYNSCTRDALSAYLACLGGLKNGLINFKNHLDVTKGYFWQNVLLRFKINNLFKIHFIQEKICTNYTSTDSLPPCL